MGKNSNSDDIITLWGQDFTRVRDGLDEEQVESFVNEVTGQRDILFQRQKHLSSLTKLAEKTVAEADSIAKQTVDEAAEQAKVETTTIIAKAEEQAQQMIEEKRAEVIAMANREAEAIRSDVQAQAKLLLGEKARCIQSELKNNAQSFYRQFFSQLESLQQQVVAFEGEFEHVLSRTMEQEKCVVLDAGSGVSTQLADSILAEAMAQVYTVDQCGNSELEKMVPALAGNDEAADCEGEVELEILPPVDIKQIMGIMRYLDSLTEVETTELIPVADRPSIIVFLREPVPLIAMLRMLPEVGQIEESTSFKDTLQSKRRKVQITLSSKNSILTDGKGVSSCGTPRYEAPSSIDTPGFL